MQTIAKLIHRATPSYLPIAFPAVYYGMPNGKIYVIYSRFYEIGFGNSGLEFVFAVHKEFKFDYEKEIIIPKKKLRLNTPIFAEQVDFPDSKINIVKICRGLNSYNEAINLLNTKAQEIFSLNKVVSNVN
ncbi:MAG TPA: hypothetical protein PLC80_15750 [Draconibacterium sp.]|nr:hypothetical protein [Draconibacterium sp.]